MSDLLDVNEAAKYLHISPYTLRGWVSQGCITYVKLGRRVFFAWQIWLKRLTLA